MATVRIPLSSSKYPGLIALVDEEDLPIVQGYRWGVDCNGEKFYARAYVRGTGAANARTVRMHRLIMPTPRGVDVDHRDENGLNNTRDNLRPATRSQNLRNTGQRRHNTSGYKGVSWHAASRTWHAQMSHGNAHVNLGSFATAEDAARAYDTAALALDGEYAHLNFPRP